MSRSARSLHPMLAGSRSTPAPRTESGLRSRQRLAAWAVAVPAGLGVFICIVMLTWNYIAARARAPFDEQRVAQLQESARTDASFAIELAEEQARQTALRQQRAAANDRIAIVLLLAATTFVASAKWRLSFEGRPALARSLFVPLRLPAGTSTSAARAQRPGRTPNLPSEPAAIDLSFVDEMVADAGTSVEAAIPILQAIQSRYRFLPDSALQRVCELTEITPAQIAGTSSFYKRFRRTPVGEHFVRVCHGTACHVAGARQVTDELRRHLEIPDGADTDSSQRFTLDEVACLGCCSLAPVLMIDEHTAGKLTALSACDALGVYLSEPAP